MCAAFSGPIEFPFVVGAEKIIFPVSVCACFLQDEIEKHMAGRVGVIFRVVPDLHCVQRVPAAKNIAEGNPFPADAEKVPTKVYELRLALRETSIKSRDAGIRKY